MQIACFLDTNILIYAAAGKRDDPRKYAIASKLVLSEYFGLSGQVLAEFYVNTSQKTRIALSTREIDRWLSLLEQYPLAPIDSAIVRSGILNSLRYQISYWDGAILAAAERLNAPILYTEDLNHDQTYGSVRVVNPFRVQ
jgi:predicted nucleic acid-binding protein